jgi:hypothetical protein
MSQDPSIYEDVARCILGGAPAEEVAGIISEGIDDEIDPNTAAELSFLAYLLKFEEFLDSVDIYAFEGWEHGEVLGHPKIGRFWIVVDLVLPEKTDLEGGMRIIGKEGQNRVLVARRGGHWIVRCKVLRRVLDEIEIRNRREAALDAKRASG